MIEKKLKFDLSEFWTYPEDKFIIRFLDLKDRNKLTLATRIKNTASQYRIRKPSGPTIIEIIQTLKELNPIIFSENLIPSQRISKQFSRIEIQTLSGWEFRTICKSIYKIDCLKKELNKIELRNIIFITMATDTNNNVTRFLNNFFGNQIIEEPRTTIIEEIGMIDIAQARSRHGQNTEIPEEIRETTEENRNEVNGYLNYHNRSSFSNLSNTALINQISQKTNKNKRFKR